MTILVIGGTIFLGRHFVEAALAAGHTVTLYHRGKSNPDLFPEVEHIYGDRRSPDDLKQLEGREWDAVLDTSGYLPDDTATMIDALGDRIGNYTFISSISAYEEPGRVGPTEDSPVLQITEEMPRDRVTNETYGAFKAECERVVVERMPDRVLNIRPGLIVGPYDGSDRFTYWTWRIARGGRVAAPGDPDETVQFIDVRDLAAWTLHMIEAGNTGTYNATGPDRPITMGSFLDRCRSALNSDAELVWIPEERLFAEEIAPYMEMPLWVPSEANGMSRTDISRALENGLTFRPVEETVRDTLEWFRGTDRADGPLRAGLSVEKEERLVG